MTQKTSKENSPKQSEKQQASYSVDEWREKWNPKREDLKLNPLFRGVMAEVWALPDKEFRQKMIELYGEDRVS